MPFAERLFLAHYEVFHWTALIWPAPFAALAIVLTVRATRRDRLHWRSVVVAVSPILLVLTTIWIGAVHAHPQFPANSIGARDTPTAIRALQGLLYLHLFAGGLGLWLRRGSRVAVFLAWLSWSFVLMQAYLTAAWMVSGTL